MRELRLLLSDSADVLPVEVFGQNLRMGVSDAPRPLQHGPRIAPI